MTAPDLTMPLRAENRPAVQSLRAEPLEEHVQDAARLMEMLASPARLRILCQLTESELSVGALADRCEMSQPTMSQQLKRLREAGLVSARRDGQSIYYSLQGAEVTEVLKVLHRLYCERDIAESGR